MRCALLHIFFALLYSVSLLFHSYVCARWKNKVWKYHDMKSSLSNKSKGRRFFGVHLLDHFGTIIAPYAHFSQYFPCTICTPRECPGKHREKCINRKSGPKRSTPTLWLVAKWLFHFEIFQKTFYTHHKPAGEISRIKKSSAGMCEASNLWDWLTWARPRKTTAIPSRNVQGQKLHLQFR